MHVPRGVFLWWFRIQVEGREEGRKYLQTVNSGEFILENHYSFLRMVTIIIFTASCIRILGWDDGMSGWRVWQKLCIIGQGLPAAGHTISSQASQQATWTLRTHFNTAHGKLAILPFLMPVWSEDWESNEVDGGRLDEGGQQRELADIRRRRMEPKRQGAGLSPGLELLGSQSQESFRWDLQLHGNYSLSLNSTMKISVIFHLNRWNNLWAFLWEILLIISRMMWEDLS